MNELTGSFLYSPALRMKAGELLGLRDLAEDIADSIIPRLIIPSSADRKNEMPLQLFDGQKIPNVNKALSSAWLFRPLLLETTHILSEFGRSRLGLWLPKMFDSARTANVRPIPLVQAANLSEDDIVAYRASIDTNYPIKFGVVFSSSDLADNDKINVSLKFIDKLQIQPQECIAIADFHDAEFSDPKIVAPIISGVLDGLQSAANWRQIIFQGTSFPEKNPATPGSRATIPRNEWIAWKMAVHFDPTTADYLTFGDYAADCARMNFKGGGGIPIPHYRYSTPDAWIVQRGADQGTHASIMKAVCKILTQDSDFAGRSFSNGDEIIYRTAYHGGGPGSAKEWRGVNTNHHITRTVNDIGSIKGLTFKKAEVSDLGEQAVMSLFENQ